MYPFFYYDVIAQEVYREALRIIELEKLDLYGVDYIFETALDINRKKLEKHQLSAYITDSLKNITEAICRIGGAENVDIPRYIDMFEESQETPEDKAEAKKNADIEAEKAMAEYQRQCALIAKERKQKAEREGEQHGN